MDAISSWLNLDGYGIYVWPSYVLTLIAVWLNVVWARRSVAAARTVARRRIETLRGGS